MDWNSVARICLPEGTPPEFTNMTGWWTSTSSIGSTSSNHHFDATLRSPFSPDPKYGNTNKKIWPNGIIFHQPSFPWNNKGSHFPYFSPPFGVFGPLYFLTPFWYNHRTSIPQLQGSRTASCFTGMTPVSPWVKGANLRSKVQMLMARFGLHQTIEGEISGQFGCFQK